MINIYELQNMPKTDLVRIMNRAQNDIDKVKSKVEEIIAAVKTDGDAALIRFTKKWDDPEFSLAKLKVTRADIEEAYRNTERDVIEKIKEQISLARNSMKSRRSKSQIGKKSLKKE